MTMKERGLDFCGLWRQGKGEVHEFLMQVVKWRIGCSVDSAYPDRLGFAGRPDKLWLRAEVIKYTEGSVYPKVLEIVLPRKNFRFVVDTYYNNSCIYGKKTKFLVEFSGNIYGPSPLLNEMSIMNVQDMQVATPSIEEIKSMEAQRKQYELITLNDRRALHDLPKLEFDGLNGFKVPECVVNEEPTFVSCSAHQRAVKSLTACDKKEKGVE
jgi:hypothetical protein